MKKEFFVGIGLIAVIGAGVFYLNQNYLQKNKPVMPIESPGQMVKTEPNTTKAITAQELSAHSTETDCWVAVEGKIYDLSNFAQKHPGGAQAIINSCGKDGTTVFNTRGDRGPHPESAKETLQTFQVGVLGN